MNGFLEFLKLLWSFLSQALLSAFPIFNTAIVVGAGFLGLRLHGRFRTSIRDIIMRALGIAVVLFAISELWNSFFVLQDGMIETEGTMLAVISLPVGWLVGEAFKNTKHSERTFADVEAVKEALRETMPKDCCILIKGSNSMKLASLVPYL